MSNNVLRMLNELSFVGQSGWEVLDLSSNELELISRNTFTHIPRLKWLTLANNKLKIPYTVLAKHEFASAASREM